jgi:tRNA A37 threonylcarbamoyladenosine dehydratase
MSGLHRFSRTELLIGTEALTRLQGCHVAVIGLGGVGSYTAEALCRSGIGHLTIIDYDDICITNINRQLHATSATVGKAKVEVMAERLRLINPAAEITALRLFYSAENSARILDGRFDYVVDAIDHFTAKLHLLVTCRERQIPVISSMGAAAKLDPTKICVGDIATTHTCRMARSVRKLLKKQGVTTGVKVVYSTEEFHPPAAQLPGCHGQCVCPNKDEEQFSCQHRRIILGSSAHIPGIFGLTMAGEVLQDLLRRDGPQPVSLLD